MTFSSLTFLFVFFPVTFLLYALIRNHTARNFILAAASLVFYAFGEPVAVMIMLISIVLNYLFGRGAAGTKWDKPAVVLAVVLNIGLLFAYKYTGFFTEILNAVFRLSIPVPQIRLPIGISFFTFQGLSYVIDVYRDKKNVQKNLFSVLLYNSFFPQLIAGPIVRYSDIAAQIQEREFSFDRISRGVCRFLFGLAKKVLLANQIDCWESSTFKRTDCPDVATLKQGTDLIYEIAERNLSRVISTAPFLYAPVRENRSVEGLADGGAVDGKYERTGYGIGSTPDDVKAAFGTPDTDEEWGIYYYGTMPMLNFYLDEETGLISGFGVMSEFVM